MKKMGSFLQEKKIRKRADSKKEAGLAKPVLSFFGLILKSLRDCLKTLHTGDNKNAELYIGRATLHF